MARTVVHFCDSAAYGGAEIAMMGLVANLDNDTWRPVIFHHDEPGLAPLIQAADEAGIARRCVPRITRSTDLRFLPAFVRALREEDAAVFHAHLAWPLACKYGILASRIARVPATVVTAHTRLDISNRPLLHIQPRYVARLVDQYFAVSHAVQDHLRDDLKIPAPKIQVIPNAIDTNHMETPCDEALRDEVAGDPRRRMIFLPARLEEEKNHQSLIRAIATLPDVVCVFAGEGSLEKELRALSEQLGVADRVRFLGHRDDVPSLMAYADVFVLPSLSEGMPLSLLEAMAAGTPVVASNIPGINEVIDDQRTGLLVAPQDPDALANAIRACFHPRKPFHHTSQRTYPTLIRNTIGVVNFVVT